MAGEAIHAASELSEGVSPSFHVGVQMRLFACGISNVVDPVRGTPLGLELTLPPGIEAVLAAPAGDSDAGPGVIRASCSAWSAACREAAARRG